MSGGVVDNANPYLTYFLSERENHNIAKTGPKQKSY